MPEMPSQKIALPRLRLEGEWWSADKRIGYCRALDKGWFIAAGPCSTVADDTYLSAYAKNGQPCPSTINEAYTILTALYSSNPPQRRLQRNKWYHIEDHPYRVGYRKGGWRLVYNGWDSVSRHELDEFHNVFDETAFDTRTQAVTALVEWRRLRECTRS